MSLAPQTAAAPGLGGAAWLSPPLRATLRGSGRARSAAREGARIAEAEALLAAAPAAPLIVSRDGTFGPSTRLRDMLGLQDFPLSLAGLASTGQGLAEEDAAALADDV